MRLLATVTLMGVFAMGLGAQDKKEKKVALPADSLYLVKTKTLDGKDADLKDYSGKVALVVNLASQ